MRMCSKCGIPINLNATDPNVGCRSCVLYYPGCNETIARIMSHTTANWCWQCPTCTIKNRLDRNETSPSTSADVEIPDIIKDVNDAKEEKPSNNKSRGESEEIETLEQKVANLEARLSKLQAIYNHENHLQALRRIEVMSERLHRIEQKDRVCNLEVRGLVECHNENLRQLIIKLGVVVNVNITESDLEWIGRVGKVNGTASYRTVLAKFRSQMVKNNLLLALRKRGRGIKMREIGLPGGERTVHVGENLTPHFRNLYATAKRVGNFRHCWTFNCDIFVRPTGNSEFIKLKSMSHLKALLETVLI